MLSFSLVAEALMGLIYHRPSGENLSFVMYTSVVSSLSTKLIKTATRICQFSQYLGTKLDMLCEIAKSVKIVIIKHSDCDSVKSDLSIIVQQNFKNTTAKKARNKDKGGFLV